MNRLTVWRSRVKIKARLTALYREPAYINRVIQAWKDNGLTLNVPYFMTEGNNLGEGGAGTVKSALWLADYVDP